jgi:tubulin polyglutamylase TTLL6/13
VQKYVRKPALYHGHKYDFRIYVLITSAISPMQLFLYEDGLVRLASEKYDKAKSHEDHFVHLTNYSLNKDNENFDEGLHKLRLKDILKGEMVNSSPSGRTYRKNAKVIWSEIEEMIVKTVFTIQPQLAHLYRTSQAKEPDLCFDLLGFDVMLDHKLKPWMLEVNHMPSFRADTDIDMQVKKNLIKNTLQILQLSLEQRRQIEEILKKEKTQIQRGNVRRMTAAEHSMRVKFDYNLIDQYVPNCGYKRIYPLDPEQP